MTRIYLIRMNRPNHELPLTTIIISNRQYLHRYINLRHTIYSLTYMIGGMVQLNRPRLIDWDLCALTIFCPIRSPHSLTYLTYGTRSLIIMDRY
ncbi:hypothetical protein MHBO_004979 [Bonamia ostreae]|uniref:Uncharacterized protein n=1 Tax=Bonamia ostreae TaxID=126728 RepID=A0ABV2AUU0_9EUKA